MPTKLEANASFRKPRLVFLVLALALVFSAVCVGGVSGADVWDGSVDTEWDGSGTESNPYLIQSAAELAGLAQKVNNSESFEGMFFELTTDIDLAHIEWTSIGTIDKKAKKIWFITSEVYYENPVPFSGIFNGNGHTISNMYIEASEEGTGLFGCVNGVISNLSITDSSISIVDSPVSVGLVIGYLYDGGKVIDCSATQSSIGLAGWAYLETIVDGYVAGGIVGDNAGGVISGSANSIGNDISDWISLQEIAIDAIVGKGGTGGSSEDTPNTPSYYIVNATSDINGQIDPSGDTSVTPGHFVEYTFIPNSGYILDKVILDNVDDIVSAENITSECLPSYSYTLDNITSNYTISVSFKLFPTYNITIPSSINISSKTNYGTMDVTASELWLPENGYVSVTVDSENGFELQHETENVHLSYNLKVNGKAGIITASNPYIANFTMEEYQQAVSSKPKVTLNATVLDNPPFTGNYTDMLTFTLEYNTKNN